MPHPHASVWPDAVTASEWRSAAATARTPTPASAGSATGYGWRRMPRSYSGRWSIDSGGPKPRTPLAAHPHTYNSPRVLTASTCIDAESCAIGVSISRDGGRGTRQSSDPSLSSSKTPGWSTPSSPTSPPPQHSTPPSSQTTNEDRALTVTAAIEPRAATHSSSPSNVSEHAARHADASAPCRRTVAASKPSACSSYSTSRSARVPASAEAPRPRATWGAALPAPVDACGREPSVPLVRWASGGGSTRDPWSRRERRVVTASDGSSSASKSHRTAASLVSASDRAMWLSAAHAARPLTGLGTSSSIATASAAAAGKPAASASLRAAMRAAATDASRVASAAAVSFRAASRSSASVNSRASAFRHTPKAASTWSGAGVLVAASAMATSTASTAARAALTARSTASRSAVSLLRWACSRAAASAAAAAASASARSRTAAAATASVPALSATSPAARRLPEWAQPMEPPEWTRPTRRPAPGTGTGAIWWGWLNFVFPTFTTGST